MSAQSKTAGARHPTSYVPKVESGEPPVRHAGTPIHIWRVPTPGTWAAGYDYTLPLPSPALGATHALGVVSGRGTVEWLDVGADTITLRLRGMMIRDVYIHFYGEV
jgi:hypothetical protein